MTVTHRTQHITSTQRDAWVEINLDALERNFKQLKEIVKTDIMAVVKADAYGHGSMAIAPILEKLGVHSFGVATVDEGIALRQCGVSVPILILGATPYWSYENCIENKLTITIYSEEQIEKIEEAARGREVNCELKIDTGMSRLGINFENAELQIQKILKSNSINLNGIFSHLSDAPNKEFSDLQKKRFDNVLAKCGQSIKGIKTHIANSYAAINYPDYRYDLSRIGIATYGQDYNFLEPLISVKGRITRIYKIKKGEYVSYDRTWKAERDSTIATVPIGYADGIARNLSNKISASYKSKQINQIGNITMDQMMFDITGVDNPRINDVVILIGKDNPIDIWAKILNTITYELVCRLKLRLPRIYTRD